MKVLKERILKDGKCYPGGILKVDKFINHQMDPNLMKDIAVEFIRRFASSKVNKIITIEASGIAPAIMMGFLMNLPVVFAKKKKPSTMDNMLTTKVTSFTKQRDYDVIISKDYLTPDDHVIFVYDFLANDELNEWFNANAMLPRASSTSADRLEPQSREWDSSLRRHSRTAASISATTA